MAPPILNLGTYGSEWLGLVYGRLDTAEKAPVAVE